MSEQGLTAIALVSESLKRAFIAGYPQLSTPLGFGPLATKTVLAQSNVAHDARFPGRPIGLTLAGRVEADLLAIAHLFEKKTWMRFQGSPNVMADIARNEL